MAVHGLSHQQIGDLPSALEEHAPAARVGSALWRPFDPARYDAAIVLGGGFSSHWTTGTLVPRALVAAALRTAGVPVAFSGQGYAFDDADLPVLEALLTGAVAVGCRDAHSAEVARALAGVDPDTVTLTGDDAMGLAPSAAPDLPTDRPLLAVTVRAADYVGSAADALARRWVLAADAVAADRGWDVLGVALNDRAPEPEIVTLARIRATTPLRAHWQTFQCGADPGRLVAAMAGAQAAAVQSYHAAVFALDAGVPAVLGAGSEYYVTKAEGLAGLAGLPTDLALRDLDQMSASLDVVTAAMGSHPAPLDDAIATVDQWWRALPARLGTESPAR